MFREKKYKASATLLKKEVIVICLFIGAWSFIAWGLGSILIWNGCFDCFGLAPFKQFGLWTAFITISCLLASYMFIFLSARLPITQYELHLTSASYTKKNDLELRFYFSRNGQSLKHKTRVRLAYTFGRRSLYGRRKRSFSWLYYVFISHEKCENGTILCSMEQRLEHPFFEYSAFVVQAYPREFWGHSLYFVIPAKTVERIATLKKTYF